MKKLITILCIFFSLNVYSQTMFDTIIEKLDTNVQRFFIETDNIYKIKEVYILDINEVNTIGIGVECRAIKIDNMIYITVDLPKKDYKKFNYDLEDYILGKYQDDMKSVLFIYMKD